jgi:hypothetical protein
MQAIMQVAIPFILIGFLMYRRVRRSIGFQKFSPKRMRFRTILFGILGLLIMTMGFIHPILFLADGVGIAIGIVLSIYAMRHFIYEWREGILFTRTHIVIESTVLILFLGRVLYRILSVFVLAKQTGAVTDNNQMAQYARDPLTVGVFCVIIVYYIVYYTFLIQKGKTLLTEKI